jgi:hypothetical protein
VRPNPFARPGTAVLGAILLVTTIAATPPPLTGRFHLTTAAFKALLTSGPEHDKLLTKVQNAAGTITNEYTPPASDAPSTIGETTIDVTALTASEAETLASLLKPDKAAQCASGAIAPQITKAKGKLTSEGYLVIEGSCFGNSGSVELSGFPNSQPKVTNEAWTPTAITVQLPKITGVPDLTMHVQVKRTLTSKVFDAAFTAATGDPIDLPFTDITMNECAGAGICAALPTHDGLGIHVDQTNTNGADIWTLKIPDHFKLDSIKLTHVTPGNISHSTINGSSSAKTIKITWAEKATTVQVPVTTSTTTDNGTSSSSIFEDVVTGGAAAIGNSGTTTTTSTTMVPETVYSESYKLEATVRGPAGMKP